MGEKETHAKYERDSKVCTLRLLEKVDHSMGECIVRFPPAVAGCMAGGGGTPLSSLCMPALYARTHTYYQGEEKPQRCFSLQLPKE